MAYRITLASLLAVAVFCICSVVETEAKRYGGICGDKNESDWQTYYVNYQEGCEAECWYHGEKCGYCTPSYSSESGKFADTCWCYNNDEPLYDLVVSDLWCK